MNLAIAYEMLGLEPLDQFITRRIAENQQQGLPDPYRQIGASTWMCVRAALDVIRGQSVLVTGDSLLEGDRLLVVTDNYIERLSGRFAQRSEIVDRVTRRYWSGALLRSAVWHRHSKKFGHGHNGPIYVDFMWKERATRLGKGPFDMVTEIRLDSFGHLQAYAEENEYLMELPLDGAIQLVRQRPDIALVGWRIPEEDEHAEADIWAGPPQPEAVQMPTLRGALTSHGAPVFNAKAYKSWGGQSAKKKGAGRRW